MGYYTRWSRQKEREEWRREDFLHRYLYGDEDVKTIRSPCRVCPNEERTRAITDLGREDMLVTVQLHCNRCGDIESRLQVVVDYTRKPSKQWWPADAELVWDFCHHCPQDLSDTEDDLLPSARMVRRENGMLECTKCRGINFPG